MVISHSKEAQPQNVSAIFIHAGAGFHSYQAESTHLWVCNQAATLGMAVLRAGGRAVDAVEVAIKFLEDHEITNAGYGSNLSVHGTVECDATIVDHLGRSGAVGAVEHIKNPISLARLVLDVSTKPLSLNRVPPNLLVGPGATEFAYENGMPVLHADFLVSGGSRERWLRWKRDLAQVEAEENHEEAPKDAQYQHPGHTSSTRSRFSSPGRGITSRSWWRSTNPTNPPSGSDGPDGVASPDTVIRPHAHLPDASVRGYEEDMNTGCLDLDLNSAEGVAESQGATDGSSQPAELRKRKRTRLPLESGTSTSTSFGYAGKAIPPEHVGDQPQRDPAEESPQHGYIMGSDDNIIDTVGAIAVDCHGNIAAGSSSGGIGMKHSGRTGPAALVGVGTAVIPVDPKDEARTCVAAVTSGTGEHMATTMASNVCAERIYSSTRKVAGQPGVFETVNEDEALEAVIDVDFMGHPGVKSSHCHAAIGVMTVKVTREGIAFYFAHNTDSFALASMNSNDSEPKCLMSRNGGHNKVAQGGRFIRFNRYMTCPKALFTMPISNNKGSIGH
ncbi:asparaginase [Histoplasma capsulatum G186AR]|uniref:Asparaginase n=1 Tax=Ajellomyces capsulatus (strain G186AR / H82 / ATCC MYA-2454 / RMSCC 2432) TaxID=447093 RepID=C0NNU3_AJECG|nr:asparaginase [Histoplasma capsulatum G186AR]EEH06603.1 asparaginase [Histoplasma capsulatum G186AR]